MKYEIYAERPRFIRDIKDLRKKFRKIHSDINSLLEDIIRNPKSHDPIPGYAGLLYKARYPIESANIGIRGGLRLIYVLDERNRLITPVNVYFKGDKEDMTVAEYNALFAEFQDG